ncbi:MAG TPA: NAD-dependent epimerase/dehydratase family protein, partial [Geobacteraceae bacterium]|nr:NAD-dependent epimerase/dehydratase family protein [Geobacteraceae bacterium]
MSVERRTILLTGSTGFLGSNLLRRLLQGGCTVVITTRTASDFWRIDDLRPMVTEFNIETNDLSEVFRRHAIDTIVHCATNYGRKEINDLLLLNANLVLPLTLLQLGAEHNVRRFINTDTVLDKRTSSYSLSKHQFKEWLKVYADRMTGINVALEHFYGPFDDESKFVTFIIRSLIKGVE